MVSVPETAELEATGAKFLEALRSQDTARSSGLTSCVRASIPRLSRAAPTLHDFGPPSAPNKRCLAPRHEWAHRYRKERLA
jgi:hypothetical protein